MTVRFEQKDATVRYLPGKVTLDKILRRYDETPFGVEPAGPVTTILRAKDVTFRGWSKRAEPADSPSQSSGSEQQSAAPIEVFIETVSAPKQTELAVQLSFADPPAVGLALSEEFKEGSRSVEKGLEATKYSASLYETVALAAGEMTVPVQFKLQDEEGGESSDCSGQLDVVLRIPKSAKAIGSDSGVALVGGSLKLGLGHLCDQRGCVEHFHEALGQLKGLAAVRPHPSMDQPAATVYLRDGHEVDLWALREQLRAQSIEVASLIPTDLDSYRLRVQLPRWGTGEQAELQQCLACRDRLREVVGRLSWAGSAVESGGGINFSPSDPRIDLVELLDAISTAGAAASAVWLVPQGVAMPKALDYQQVALPGDSKQRGLASHPIVEFELGHSCSVGTQLVSMLNGQKWVSQTLIRSTRGTLAIARIDDRSHANLTTLLGQVRLAGHTPSRIRLRDFGDIRIQLEFAHICGEVEYSKPPKPKKDDKKKSEKKDSASKSKKKPFVPRPLRPVANSNGRKAIEEAIAGVEWIGQGIFRGYHTKLEFRGGPRKLWFSMMAKGDDVVRLDLLIDALRSAGFPPKSIVISRLHPGIGFAKSMPGDVELVNSEKARISLASLKQPARPLVLAFVSLNCKNRKYSKYKADPSLYARLRETVKTYGDRVDFIAVSSNKDDGFDQVAGFWEKAGMTVPLFHDSDGAAQRALNAQTTPPPHMFVFDSDALLRYAGEPHNHWEETNKKQEDYLAQALELVLSGKYQENGAVFFNKAVCNCSDPKCKCPKCGCGSSCRCGIGHCSVGF